MLLVQLYRSQGNSYVHYVNYPIDDPRYQNFCTQFMISAHEPLEMCFGVRHICTGSNGDGRSAGARRNNKLLE